MVRLAELRPGNTRLHVEGSDGPVPFGRNDHRPVRARRIAMEPPHGSLQVFYATIGTSRIWAPRRRPRRDVEAITENQVGLNLDWSASMARARWRGGGSEGPELPRTAGLRPRLVRERRVPPQKVRGRVATTATSDPPPSRIRQPVDPPQQRRPSHTQMTFRLATTKSNGLKESRLPTYRTSPLAHSLR